MAKPVIAYRTILRNAGVVLSASSTESGFAVGNLKDFRSFTLWKSAVLTSPITIDIDLGASGSADADYLALINHNILALGGTLKVYADTVTPPVTVAQAAYSPTSDVVEYKSFTAPGVKRYWRLEIAHAAPPFTAKPFIGELQIGLKTTLPDFVSPDIDPFLYSVSVAGLRSPGGNYLGAVLDGIRRRGTLSFGGPAGIARSFFTSDLNAFLTGRALRREPFLLVFDSADSDFSRGLWVKVPDGDDVPRLPVGQTYDRFRFDLPIEEAMTEAA